MPFIEVRELTKKYGTEVPALSRVSFAVEKGEWVAVMSDGVHSFTELLPTDLCPTSAPVPLPVVLRELLAIKNTNGVFVQRRVQRFLQQCAQRHWQHHDDLSVGVIYLGD